MKKALKITLKALAVLFAAVLFLLFFYVPRYWVVRRNVTPAQKSGEEITIMSTNVRFYNPLDLLKKSWFYRADLIGAGNNPMVETTAGCFI